jgi:Na+-transporting methylmalonyl-CoA/oxaloacetate decarboxylase gamma subunit
MFLGLLLQVSSDTTQAIIKRNSDLFLKLDPIGIGMTVIGYAVVFIALLLLYLLFFNVAKVLQLNVKRLLRKEGKIIEKKEYISVSGEVNAAIAMALHLYYSEMHDKEDTVLTINKVSRNYSPWSSKIYGLRQHLR